MPEETAAPFISKWNRQFAQHLAQLARVLGQLIGPDEHQRNDDNDEQLGKSDLHVYTIPFRLLAGQSRLR